MHKTLFLDRDGVINHIIRYETGWDSPQRPGDVKLVKGIEKIILWANENKIPVIEVSNQPGVAKGKMSQKTSDAIEKRIHHLLKEKCAIIDKVYICSHHPNAVVSKLKKNCNCRKPKPGLLLRAAKELKINLSKSIMLGDKASDMEAGAGAGCKTIILIHNEDVFEKVKESKKIKSDYKVISIKEAFQIIQKYFKSR